MRELYWTSLIFAVIGGINWGLVGLFNFDLVAALFGEMTFISRSIYVLIGLGSISLLLLAIPKESTTSGNMPSPSGTGAR